MNLQKASNETVYEAFAGKCMLSSLIGELETFVRILNVSLKFTLETSVLLGCSSAVFSFSSGAGESLPLSDLAISEVSAYASL